MSTHSKAAVWRAFNSKEHADRLESIMREHLALAKELSDNLCGYSGAPEARILFNRISQLRQERDAILQKFEVIYGT